MRPVTTPCCCVASTVTVRGLCSSCPQRRSATVPPRPAHAGEQPAAPRGSVSPQSHTASKQQREAPAPTVCESAASRLSLFQTHSGLPPARRPPRRGPVLQAQWRPRGSSVMPPAAGVPPGSLSTLNYSMPEDCTCDFRPSAPPARTICHRHAMHVYKPPSTSPCPCLSFPHGKRDLSSVRGCPTRVSWAGPRCTRTELTPAQRRKGRLLPSSSFPRPAAAGSPPQTQRRPRDRPRPRGAPGSSREGTATRTSELVCPGEAVRGPG